MSDGNFIRNIWYVAAWSHELEPAAPLGRIVAGEPIVLWRLPDGSPVALEDRCPHRHAALSLGRVEGNSIRCMYHGLKLAADGRCVSVPGTSAIPPNSNARRFPVFEKWDWLWVWTGDPALADPAMIPDAFGLETPDWSLRAGGMDYAADYQLINDNLCDLSHLDFTHETTLGAAGCRTWSDSAPRITSLPNGLLFERWFQDHQFSPDNKERFDTWSSVRYLLPGLFLMTTKSFPVGTAAASDFREPSGTPAYLRVEQQSVTPTVPGRSRYLYASGVASANAAPEVLEARLKVVNAAFAEDKLMIETQQRIWDLTPPNRTKAFLPQDKGPALFRRMVAGRIAAEQSVAAPARTPIAAE